MCTVYGYARASPRPIPPPANPHVALRLPKSRDNEDMSAALFSTDDLYSIRAIAHEPNCFEWICSSLCPSIFGEFCMGV